MGHGDGTIVREANNRYRGAKTVRGKRIYARGATRTEVREKLKAKEELLTLGVTLTPDVKTIGDVLERWLKEASPKRARVNSTNTTESHAWAVNRHLIPNLGKAKIENLTREDIEDVFKKLAQGGEKSTSEKGLSRDSLIKLRATLHMALDWANRKQWMRWNPAVGVEVPKVAKPPSKRKSMTADEVKRLVAVAQKDPTFGPLWITMLAAGLRPGEATGLAREDIDLNAKEIHVHKSLARQRVDGKQVLRRGPVKASSERMVAIPPTAVRVLRKHFKAIDDRRALAGGEWIEDDWLPAFPTTWGAPIDPSNLRRAFRLAVAKAKIAGTWTPYELRHTSISLLSDAGIDKRLIADLAGHRNTRMVDETYRHSIRAVQDASLGMESFLGTGTTRRTTTKGK